MDKSMQFCDQWLHFEEFWEVSVVTVVVKNLRWVGWVGHQKNPPKMCWRNIGMVPYVFVDCLLCCKVIHVFDPNRPVPVFGQNCMLSSWRLGGASPKSCIFLPKLVLFSNVCSKRSYIFCKNVKNPNKRKWYSKRSGKIMGGNKRIRPKLRITFFPF